VKKLKQPSKSESLEMGQLSSESMVVCNNTADEDDRHEDFTIDTVLDIDIRLYKYVGSQRNERTLARV